MRSEAAMEKVQTRILDDGSPVHSWHTLMAELASIVQNTCRMQKGVEGTPTFELITTPDDKQKRALDLIAEIKM